MLTPPFRRPVPVPDDTTRFHWEAAAHRTLVVQRCPACGRWQYPPDVGCPGCLGDELVPTEVSGRGTVYTFTVVRQAFDRAYVDALPLIVALVELEEAPGVRLLTNIVGTDPGAVAVGMPVEVAFESLGDGALPVFQPC